MKQKQYTLFRTQRFFPLFLTQFLGAFNDNVFKNALVILITYVMAQQSDHHADILVTLAAFFFILPFFLFSATAGQLADKYDKAIVIRYVKFAEIILMLIAAFGFFQHHLWILMITLFLTGVQATFFGPLKYAILPDHLLANELIAGNALIEAGTFLAILLGTITGGVVILTQAGVWIISSLLISCAILGWITSFFIPTAPSVLPNMKINLNAIKETWNIIKFSKQSRDIFVAIIAISWFWLIGATFLSQIPTYTKVILGGNEYIVTLFLTLFSIGIGLGSLLCNQLLKGQVRSTYVPHAALGITVFIIDLYFASSNITVPTTLIDLSTFLHSFIGWHIIIDLLLLSVCGGIYIVPLYAILQSRGEKGHTSRIIASNNILNSLFMTISALYIIALLTLKVSIITIFLIIAIFNLPMAIFIRKRLPE